MKVRKPVFRVMDEFPFVKKILVEYDAEGCDSREEGIERMYTVFERRTGRKMLEASSASPSFLGRGLSAFNLKCRSFSEKPISVECLFQAGKVFENGGPYKDLLNKQSWQAKKDARLRSSGALVAFDLCGERYPLEPKTFFYNWLYINALIDNPELADEVVKYDAFSDIFFTPGRQINCQAEALAVYVGLTRAGLLETALENVESFRRTVYGC